MAEDKKDAFTFSDKIKNSKPAFNPFSKRASSKIGNNGKPKKTLFERTRRDAPFFIAALAALLMLPFLYKYSGSISDGEALVAPGMSDTVFDPERFDFSPSTEDSSSQISQLVGRDPLSLIKGWGSSESTTESTRYDYDDRDGFADYAASRNNNSKRVTEVSTYRRRAPRATRAAFKRNPTKIGELRGAGLNTRGGGGVGSRFGGALRNAAKKDSSGPLRKPTKPVSLQPLRAAGSPSRSYYGPNGVQQARASRDALSKGNAAQALKDALFKPIENGRLGGLADGFFGGPGGAGKMERNMDFKGITPWWWDMMKDRAQKRWQYRFDLFRKPFAELLGKIIAGEIGCCIMTGNPDCDAGTFFGAPSEGIAPYGTCCGQKQANIETVIINTLGGQEAYAALGGWGERACKNFANYVKAQGKSELCSSEKWKEHRGTAASSGGFFKTRRDCLGGTRSKFTGEGGITTKICDTEKNVVQFQLTAPGAVNWNAYHVVFAKNENGLCPNATNRTVSVAGVNKDARRRGKIPGHEDQNLEGVSKHHLGYDNEIPFDPEDEGNLCVVYVAQGLTLDYTDYVYELNTLAKRKGMSVEDIKIVKVRGYIMKYPLSNLFNGNWFTGLPIMKRMPMSVSDFFYSYVREGRGKWSRKYYGYADCDFEQVVPPVEDTVEPDPVEPDPVEPDPVEPDPVEPDPDPEVVYTRLANSLNEIPADFMCREAMPSSYEPLVGLAATHAARGVDARRAAHNMLPEDATKLLSDNCEQYFSGPCLPINGANGRTDDNLKLCSIQASEFVNKVIEKYNEKAKAENKPLIRYTANCPTIANLVDAMHIAQQLGMQQMPKAAACQLGKMMGTLFKDETIQSKYAQNKNGDPYKNMFGAFASYIGLDSAYFPAPRAEDAPRNVNTSGPGKNPRFYNETTDPKNTWHYGMYVWNVTGGYWDTDHISKTFKEDVQGRIQGNPYPLAALRLPVTYKDPNTNKNIQDNREAYWNAYTPVYVEQGCDNVYGTATMSIAEVERYFHNVCEVQNGSNIGFQKPRATGRYTPSGNVIPGDRSNTELECDVNGVCRMPAQ